MTTTPDHEARVLHEAMTSVRRVVAPPRHYTDSDSEISEPILDTERLRALRLRSGLSERALARALGVSATTVHALERGTNHPELTLRFLVDLTAVLGVSISELLPRRAAEPAAPARDDVTVEAALATLPGSIPAGSLAEALGWDLKRTKRALKLLENRLATTGQRLHDAGWQKVVLRPSTEHLSDEQLRAVQSAGPRIHGLTIRSARLLADAANRRIDGTWRKTAGSPDRAELHRLVEQGLVTIDSTGAARLSPDTRYGLFPEQFDRDGNPRNPDDIEEYDD